MRFVQTNAVVVPVLAASAAGAVVCGFSQSLIALIIIPGSLGRRPV